MRFFDHPRLRPIAFCLWCLAWAVVVAALLAPIGIPTPSGSDLLAHGMLFAVMALATATFCPRPARLVPPALVTFGAGIALEFAQGLVPYRHFDVLDALANTTGSALGFTGAVLILCLARPPAAADEAGVSSNSPSRIWTGS